VPTRPEPGVECKSGTRRQRRVR